MCIKLPTGGVPHLIDSLRNTVQTFPDGNLYSIVAHDIIRWKL